MRNRTPRQPPRFRRSAPRRPRARHWRLRDRRRARPGFRAAGRCSACGRETAADPARPSAVSTGSEFAAIEQQLEPGLAADAEMMPAAAADLEVFVSSRWNSICSHDGTFVPQIVGHVLAPEHPDLRQDVIGQPVHVRRARRAPHGGQRAHVGEDGFDEARFGSFRADRQVQREAVDIAVPTTAASAARATSAACAGS